MRIPAGVVPFHCRWPVAAGKACVCRVGWGAPVMMVSPHVFVGACPQFRPWVRALGGSPDIAPGRCQWR